MRTKEQAQEKQNTEACHDVRQMWVEIQAWGEHRNIGGTQNTGSTGEQEIEGYNHKKKEITNLNYNTCVHNAVPGATC